MAFFDHNFQLDAVAPVLANLNQPIVIAKIDADKYRKLASKHEIEYVLAHFISFQSFSYGVDELSFMTTMRSRKFSIFQ